MDRVSLFALAAILLLAGCGARQEIQSAGQPPAYSSSFLFPESPAEYTAIYAVNEGGVEVEKKVVAAGRNMKVVISGLAVYFLSDRAYSCSEITGKVKCFEITSSAAGMKPDEVYLCKNIQGAEEVERVDIGGTEGRCYLLPMAPTPAKYRKICCTDRNVLAYDEYVLADGTTRVEYLKEIAYEVDYREFLLPAELPAGR
ncbi:MAG: hypothetical protein N3G22_03325 [Candidatus Micrarchaeota archaeon]|nr:hypothetical protein [Candidatus Micrarchaeota archaeon]